MSEGGWRGVWARRRLDPARGSLLAQLMAADGLDTGFGDVGEAAWGAYVERIAARLGIGRGDSVFEVGCGAGAFLLPLHRAGARVAGLDSSPALVEIARSAMPGADFELAEADALDASARADFVVSSGVFNYFPDAAYAARVLGAMARKARRGVAVLDVPDAARRAEALRMRRAGMGERAYEERYRGLDHLYLERAWVERVLREAGAAAVATEDQAIEGYANSAYRFNALATLRSPERARLC